MWKHLHVHSFAGEAIEPYRRVTLSGGKLVKAGLTDRELGTIEEAAFADGDLRAVRLRTAQGTCKMVAAGAIAVGDLVYTSGFGRVSATATATSYLLGTALEAASIAGDVIEVLRNSHGDTAAT